VRSGLCTEDQLGAFITALPADRGESESSIYTSALRFGGAGGVAQPSVGAGDETNDAGGLGQGSESAAAGAEGEPSEDGTIPGVWDRRAGLGEVVDVGKRGYAHRRRARRWSGMVSPLRGRVLCVWAIDDGTCVDAQCSSGAGADALGSG
jgi:hypothetical protein